MICAVLRKCFGCFGSSEEPSNPVEPVLQMGGATNIIHPSLPPNASRDEKVTSQDGSSSETMVEKPGGELGGGHIALTAMGPDEGGKDEVQPISVHVFKGLAAKPPIYSSKKLPPIYSNPNWQMIAGEQQVPGLCPPRWAEVRGEQQPLSDGLPMTKQVRIPAQMTITDAEDIEYWKNPDKIAVQPVPRRLPPLVQRPAAL